MLPRLINKFDVKKGVLIGAVVVALWHVPFVLGGIQYIKGVPFFLLLLVYPIGLTGVQIVISWFWIKTKSIWIVCITHGALNNWGQYAFKYMQESPKNYADSMWLLIALNGALFILGLIILITRKNTYMTEKSSRQLTAYSN